MTTIGKFLAAGLVGMALASAQAAVPVVSYSFNGTLAADQSGAPMLTAIDPLGANGFETATVGGVSRTVYRWADVADSSDSHHGGGLQLSTQGLLSDAHSYALVLNFEFTGAHLDGGGWRRIVDTEARQSDNGFYVAPPSSDNVLHVVQAAETGAPAITNGVHSFGTPGFHALWLTVQGVAPGQQQVRAWMDGQLELTAITTSFSLDNAHNPGGLLSFFADNLAAGAQQEYANGRIASLALYDGAVSPSAVPEPQAALMFLAGLAGLVLWRRRSAAVRNVTPAG